MTPLQTRKQIAKLELSAGRIDNASKLYLNILKEYPEDLESMEVITDIFRMDGNTTITQRMVDRMIEVSPHNPYAIKLKSLLRQTNTGPYAHGNELRTPGTVHFLMNDKCNAKCIMCGDDYAMSKTGRVLTLNQFKKSAQNLHMEDFKVCLLAGGGDPLVNPDIIPIMNFMKSDYPHVKLALVTNGISLTQKMAQATINANVGHINISINSATKPTYRHIMQVDQFDRVCKNVNQIRKMASESEHPLVLQFSIALSLLNIEELPELIRLAHQLGVKSVNSMYCRFYPETIRHLSVKKEEERLSDRDSLFFHKELSDRIVKDTRELAQQQDIQFSHEPLFEDKAPATRCTWTQNQLMVGYQGEIYPCGGAELHMKPKVESGAYNFGNAVDDPLETYWNNDDYVKLRLSSKQTGDYPIKECSECANVFDANRKSCHIYNWEGFESDESLVQLGKANNQGGALKYPL